MTAIQAHQKTIAAKFLCEPCFNLWKEILFDLLPYNPHPLIATPEHILSSAAIWSYVKLWKDTFRKAGATKGQSVVIALEPSPEWVIAFLACVWEDLTVILCHESDIHLAKTLCPWAVLSRNEAVANWRFSSNLEPLSLQTPNQKIHAILDNRILFLSEKSKIGITDTMIAKWFLNKEFVKPGEAVISSLDFSTPVGFYFDFFSSFFSQREIFLVHRLMEREELLKALLSAHTIEHIVSNSEVYDKISQLKTELKDQKPFLTKLLFQESQMNDLSLLFLDGDLPLSQK
jgi:hypothetical protein